MVLSHVIFFLILTAIFVQRILEAGHSKRNVAALTAEGGKELTTNSLLLVVIMQLSWFVAMIVEVIYFQRPFIPWLGALGFLGAITGQGLRYLSMKALGKRWTLPTTILPNAPVVVSGPYKYLRHPNWLGVIIEIGMVPLIHTAYFTAIIYTILNAFVIGKRVQVEEQALSNSSDYAKAFAQHPRFIPRLFGHSQK